MHASALFYGLVFLQAAVASPVVEPIGPEPEVKPRDIEPRMPGPGDIPFPRWPAKNPNYKRGYNNDNNNHNKNKDCSTGGSNQQTNICSAGAPYCCTSDGNGGHICQNTTACEQTVICCNNNNGFQICIGDMDFNVPITINVYYDD
ncbi:hypothetical protein EDB81DRAFT_893163 [Dactylonectria macrodidyma]|uniref:Hydrophobin n=1 Tax=Dactylonectria macrodidyma TaxID=307937 RepID=A0A9P9D8R6_9HYPO|nr:hypothetical protein EDB81DRAFT_920517 [Dactylonectria macrodidyma]KAH7114639.1 hypothetical protein EDB81DRAFT_893129 [Dactylonectria macrodidyma]KAH7114653.1 hypothetical protein EDB81DRAFT_893163 [Dactylonectria macrodidyma]